MFMLVIRACTVDDFVPLALVPDIHSRTVRIPPQFDQAKAGFGDAYSSSSITD